MSNEITNALVAIKPARLNKAGRQIKPVFGVWQGAALITQSGRLASRKDLGAIKELKGAALTEAHSQSVEKFNKLGESALSSEQSAVAKGTREMKRIYVNPKTGRTILETAPANKAAKVAKILEEKGLDSELVDSILQALKIA